jgi:hypothetical protein
MLGAHLRIGCSFALVLLFGFIATTGVWGYVWYQASTDPARCPEAQTEASITVSRGPIGDATWCHYRDPVTGESVRGTLVADEFSVTAYRRYLVVGLAFATVAGTGVAYRQFLAEQRKAVVDG